MMWWWYDGWNGYWNWNGPWMVGPAFMITVVALCIIMMFMMMRGMMGRHRSRGALDLLKERFARGEITQAEYEERRRLIEA